jgi:hypothetical protein
MVIAPVRGVVSGFGATVYVSQEAPAPVLPSGIVIQDTLLEADQSHVAAVEMKTLLVVPLALGETAVGENP